jgi:hypothetical protein
VSLTLVGELKEEFKDAEIPDWRLRERLLAVAKDVEAAPEKSLPRVSKTTAAREAAYRFLGNSRVGMGGILAPHTRATVRRCREARQVYVVSDTTEFTFSGEDRGKKLGRVGTKSRGFLGHFGLAVSEAGRPLGVLDIDVIVRAEQPKKHANTHQRKKDPTRESLRWSAMVARTSAQLAGCEVIHVMDSEADIYELLCELQAKGERFIIRSGQDRLVEQGHLQQAVEAGEVLLSRDVYMARRRRADTLPRSRRNPARAGRRTELHVSSMQLSLRRPKTTTSDYPQQLAVNVVRVREVNPPEGETPVEWILFTSQPVATGSQVAAVVDGYRRRWLIEEYFKAIKTGCNYERRELESLRTLTNMLGIVAVIAWRLLLLRAVERQNSQQPAEELLGSDLVQALAARLVDIREPKQLPANPTVADVMRGIARLAGHITTNGPPGWQTLWHGYQDLLTWGGGYLTRAKSITYSDQS